MQIKIEVSPEGKITAEGNFTPEYLAKFAKRIGATREALQALVSEAPELHAGMELVPAVGSIPKTVHRPLSQAGMIISYLNARNGRGAGIDLLVKRIRPKHVPSLRAVLSRLASSGEIERVGVGSYRKAH